jgi:hypothetical protein
MENMTRTEATKSWETNRHLIYLDRKREECRCGKLVRYKAKVAHMVKGMEDLCKDCYIDLCQNIKDF